MFPRLAVAVLTALVASTAHAAAPAAPSPAQPVELRLNAAITVGADGRMQSLEWSRLEKVQKLIAERVEPAVRKWHFEPGRIDGVAAPTQTFLHLVFKGLPGADGSMKLEFVSAETGAGASKFVAPSYPSSAARAGLTAAVIAIVDFDAKGVASMRSYDYYGDGKYRDRFVDATRDALALWKVELERVGGHPIPTSMRIPVKFCLDMCMPLPPDANGKPVDTRHPVALESAVKLLDAGDPLAGL